MRRVFPALTVASLLSSLVGCHTAGICDCDGLDDPCCYYEYLYVHYPPGAGPPAHSPYQQAPLPARAMVPQATKAAETPRPMASPPPGLSPLPVLLGKPEAYRPPENAGYPVARRSSVKGSGSFSLLPAAWWARLKGDADSSDDGDRLRTRPTGLLTRLFH